jgi:hypothetical protein
MSMHTESSIDWRQRAAMLRLQAEDLGGLAIALAEQGRYRAEDPVYRVSLALRDLCNRREAAATELLAMGEATERAARDREYEEDRARRRQRERRFWRTLGLGATSLATFVAFTTLLGPDSSRRDHPITTADMIPQREWMAVSTPADTSSPAATSGDRNP